MYCDFYLLYPELNTKTSEIKKMSIPELQKKLNNHSFVPNESNTK